jgi:bacteriocin biosynthesis cyclodehydratase domain-containing protein
MNPTPQRPCLALPFTFLTAPGRVRLVAGEDFRYTLEGDGLDDWLPAWLASLDGHEPLDKALDRLPEPHRPAAQHILERLAGERVVIDGPAPMAHVPADRPLALEGPPTLLAGLAIPAGGDPSCPPVPVLCQDTLDFHAALAFNHRCLTGASPWFWLSCAPLARAYFSPAFLPDAGPCLECLFRSFRRLSPVPELYTELSEHGERGGPFTPAPFPHQGIALLGNLLRWKAELLARPEPPAALFRLHVLEAESLEVSAHRVLADPECPACARRGSP